MPDFIKINGTTVRTTGFYRRLIPRTDGADLLELELVVIIRGSMANRAFKQLLSAPHLIVDSAHGATAERFDAAIEHVQVAASGDGEAAAFRYDLKLRETPESADKRASERVAEPAVSTPAPAKRSYAMPNLDEDAEGDYDLSRVRLSTDAAVWSKALTQLKAAKSGRPEAPPEPPLTQPERAAIEAILVGLRLDALIAELKIAGVLGEYAVDDTFSRLVRERFVTEATPLVGEMIAKRAERDLLG